jgi:NAD(P)-dependent dehydrogenase (short-subunit alcohol dehydrogenase family)
MQKNPKKKAAFVTGAAKRIGRQIALTLAEQGFDIALHYKNSRKDAESTAKEIRSKGVACQLFSCDLSDLKKVEETFARAYAKMPHLNILVNSASLFKTDTLVKSKQALIEKHFNTNFFAPYLLTQKFAQKCKKGQIINIIDSSIMKNKTKHFSYLLTKKALAELTKMASIELAPNIRVNGIAPGLILPPPGKKESYVTRRAKTIPLKRRGYPQMIADAAVYLINNPFITGHIIFVDGGEQFINPE